MNKEYIKFEADVQRQHARFRMPLTCIIGEDAYHVFDWGVSGLSILAEQAHFMHGRTYKVGIVFPFYGFDFVVTVDATADQGTEGGKVQFFYVNVDAPRLSVLRYIADAYAVAEIVTAGEVLDVSRRAPDVGANKSAGPKPATKRSPLFMVGQVLRFGLVGVVTLALVAFIGGSLVQRLGTIPTESAAIAVGSTPLLARDTGVLTNVVTGPVALGQLVATIETPSSNTATLYSPCDCIVSSVEAETGSSVSPGDAIALLRPQVAVPYVQAWVRLDKVIDLYKGVTADIEFYDGTVFRGVQLGELPTVDASAQLPGDLVAVRIELPQSDLMPQPNQPVHVRFIRNTALNMSWLGRTVDSARAWLTGVLG